MSPLDRLVLRLRPAPLASAVANLFGLSKRRFVVTDSGTFFVNPVSEFGSIIVRGDHYEPEMKNVLLRYLKEGSVFIDLGANEGYFSIIASRYVGANGRVIAVEPQSRLRSVIDANIGANNCRNIQLIRAAIFSQTGQVDIRLSSDRNTGSTSLYRTTKYLLPLEKVPSLTLAELLEKNGIDHCDLMKIDIEGAEYDVLIGAEATLRQGRIRHIAVEFHNALLERHGSSARHLHEWIVSCGYQMNDVPGPSVYTFCED